MRCLSLIHILLLEKEAVGGVIGKVSTVTHYSALLPNETGSSFAERMKEQALHAGVEIRYENVTKAELNGCLLYTSSQTAKGRMKCVFCIARQGFAEIPRSRKTYISCMHFRRLSSCFCLKN